MPVAAGVAALAARVAAEFKAVRAEIAALPSGGGGTDPWTYAYLTADVSNSTLTAITIDGLAIPASVFPGKYIFEGKFLLTSAATTTAVQMAMQFPPLNVDWAALWQLPSSGATTTVVSNQTANAVYTAGTAWPGATPQDFLGIVDGVFVVTNSLSNNIYPVIKSEVNNSAVVCKAGSFIRWRRLGS